MTSYFNLLKLINILAVAFWSLLTQLLNAAEPPLSQKSVLVQHEPLQPKADLPVLVTAQLGKGATKAVLKIQAVAPGQYVRKSDPAYEKEWTELPLHDDGLEGDAKAGDGIFSTQVAASYQKHRWLLRYRITAQGADGNELRLPAKEDACPNYAWWCDNGPAAWTGASEPGKSPAVTYPPEFLSTLQSLHLLARADDVARSQWDGNFHKQKQLGTLVYRGVVYDHIQFSNRGQGSAHIAGKNKWGLKFNKGHDIPFVDHTGVPFPDEVDSLDLNPGGSTPYLPVLRGITGLDEVLSMRVYRLAGVPTPPATWIQWRVVITADEVSDKDQYIGDLWGVYVAIGEMEPKLLSDHKLADGLVVSAQSGIKHTPRAMQDAPQQWEKFLQGLRSNPNENWCRQNLDLPAYYSFHALNRLLGNVDLRPDGNHGYYRHPDGRWAPIPWDNDMMFVPRHHQPGYIEAATCLQHPKILIEYRNRGREILDLFCADTNAKGGQIGQLVADLGVTITPPNQKLDWSRLDEAVWNHHPRFNQRGSYFVNPATADHFGGQWKRTLSSNDFAGFQKYLVDFCTDSRPTKNYAPNDGDQRGYGWGYLAHETKDDQIPSTPTIKQLGENKQRFEATAFASPVGHQAGALEWRVGKIGQRGEYELTELWRGETLVNEQKLIDTEIEIAAEVFQKPGTYRVRARWRDQTNRAGHWSQPLEIHTR